MRLPYDIGIHLYRAAIACAALKNGKARLLHRGQLQSLRRLRNAIPAVRQPGEKWVWIHAASLGEFEQGRPLIERIRAERPGYKMLLTFFSPSGYEVRKNYPGVDVVAYLPMDTKHNVRRFLDMARPDIAIFVKYEFWGNYLHALKRRKIPTYIISAIFRPGQAFFKPWGGESRSMLRCFTHLYVQDEASKQLLAGIGITNVTVAGDTRFDRVADITHKARQVPFIDKMTEGVANVLVAGSTWPPDEAMLAKWLREHPDVKAIIAPHEFSPDRLAALRNLFGPKDTQLLSQAEQIDARDTRVLIIDCFGLLSSLYRYGTWAYVGGGFGTGIHNINEAAAYAIPVVYGPHNKKFKEATDMAACGGGFPLKTAEDFAQVADVLTSADTTRRTRAAKAAGDYIARSVGATDIIFYDLFNTTAADTTI